MAFNYLFIILITTASASALPDGCEWIEVSSNGLDGPLVCETHDKKFLAYSDCMVEESAGLPMLLRSALCCDEYVSYNYAYWVGGDLTPFCNGKCSDCGEGDCIDTSTCATAPYCVTGQKVLCANKTLTVEALLANKKRQQERITEESKAYIEIANLQLLQTIAAAMDRVKGEFYCYFPISINLVVELPFTRYFLFCR